MRYLITLLILFSSSVYSDSNSESDPFTSEILPPHSMIQNKNLGDWGGEWWKWAFSFGKSASPITDLRGNLCNLGQHGNVWFLAGSYSTEPVVRECTIPEGKTIFFPIINFIYYSPKNDPVTCDVVTVTVNARTKKPSDLFFRINDVEIKDPYLHREASIGCFDPFARLINDSSKTSWAYPAASNGYWIAVKPLSIGTHILQFGGNLPKFRQNITYKLHVIPHVEQENMLTKTN